ncbi:MAG: 5-formyltetrahydrofolate cyclo-ligase [Aquifex sp.]|nr:MAG: 5-formyltetrahydrofolate cyclo-ligase [Aquifex sp.]
MLKSELRKKVLHKRINLPEEERKVLSERVINNLKNLPEFKKAKRVALYCPTKGEVDLTPLFPEVLKEKELILPKVEGNEISLYRVHSQACLRRGSFGILEPEEGEEVNPKDVDLIAVPGIAFDLEGYRLGFGKGYYDRLLKKIKGLKVGVAYSFQVFDRLPRDAWDVPVDVLITEKNVRRLRDGRL